MPSIHVEYLASFSAHTRCRSERLTIRRGETLDAVKARLVRKYGRPFATLLDRDMTVVSVNGAVSPGDRELGNGDRLTFATLVGGG